MRRTKLLGVAALVAAVTLVGASPAAAGIAMRASLSGVVTAIMPGPSDLVTQRCGPELPQAIVQSSGTGTLTSEVYAGSVTWSEEHCTLILHVRKDGLLTVAFVHLGVMVLVADGGTLTMSQSAPGVLMGDLFAGPNTHTGNGPYAITGGTGIFADATGHGHVTGTATNAGGTPITTIAFELIGSLAVP